MQTMMTRVNAWATKNGLRDPRDGVDHFVEGAVEHVIITRFEVDLAGKYFKRPDLDESEIGTEARLRARMDLFERYCLPSVLAQTCQNFRWMIFFRCQDRHIIEPWLEKLRVFAGATMIEPIWLDNEVFGFDTAGKYLNEKRDVSLLTTRLDSDDMIHPEFVAQTQAAAIALGPKDQRFIGFPFGNTFKQGRLYLTYHPANPLMSYVEPYYLHQTVHRQNHEHTAGKGKVKVPGWKPMWLQVVHDHNLSTLADGLRVSARALPETYVNVSWQPDPDDQLRRTFDRARTGGRLIWKIVASPRARYRLLALLPFGPKKMPPVKR